MDSGINLMEDYLLHVYNRFPIIFEKGSGMYLYDEKGKEYLDFGSGIGVMAFGYGNKTFSDSIKSQVDMLLHTSNLFYHSGIRSAAKDICEFSKMDKVFFTNSGAEAVEGAIKASKRYAYNNKKPGQEIIAFNHSFHGRTVGSLSVTGNDHYREPFYPLMDGVKFAKYNDIDSVKSLINDKTCAIIVEPIQGEGGVIPGEESFLKALRELCDSNDLVLIFDEIQCGLCRSGYPYVWQKYDIKPDILCTAKALGLGIPVGAFLLSKKLSQNSLTAGDHGTTYGGNPLAMAAVHASISLMKDNDICAHVKSLTSYFEDMLKRLVSECDNAISWRGSGFMQGIELKNPVVDYVKKSLEEGLIVLSAEGNVLRLLPPLIAEKEHFDKCFDILKNIL